MGLNRRFSGLAAAACLALTATACGGEGGEEAVFLYFINAYPGTGSMTVNANTGTLAANVPFGERYGDGGSCGPESSGCVPIRVERQLGGDFTYLLENMIQPADVQKDLYSMYPHETGTVVLTRRANETSINTTLLRHTQTISSTCGIMFVNGLSVNNTYLALGGYDMAPEIFEEEIAFAGFVDEASTPFISECGALPTTDQTHTNLQRPQVLAAIRENPWFFIACDGDVGESATSAAPLPGCRLRWGIPNQDGRAPMDESGTIYSVLDSREYFECIQAGISLRQPEGTMAMPGFPLPEPDCPTEPVTWADVDIDAQVVEQCNRPISRTVEMIAPAADDTGRAYFGGAVCELTFRVRNPGLDIIFGPAGNDDLGSHGDGAPVESVVSIPDGALHFYVLFGRPVNPLVWQWDSSDAFVNLATYPYFNDGGDRPQIGDTDWD